jgi:signal transduction histidine kinase
MTVRLLSRLPLATRVPLIAAVMMALVGLVASWLVLSALDRVQGERLQELAALHLDGLSVAVGPMVLRRDIWEIYDALDRAGSAGDGRRLVMTAVADEAGRVLAASDPRRAPIDSALAPLAAGAQSLDAIAVSADARIRVTAPLVYQGREVGRILTEIDVADLVGERRRAAVLLLAGNALATAALTVVGFVATRRMLGPLARLAARMDAAGGTPSAIDATEIPAGDGEVARLFRTYNGMVEAIAAKTDAERRLAERERLVSLGRLASALAHEINNPLGGLMNAADTIRRYADRPDVVGTSAALIERGLARLRDVARAALDHQRLSADDTPLGPDDLDDLRLLVTPEAERLGQRLDWAVGVSAEALGSWPAAKVRQIALNLLLNASAAAGRDGWLALSAGAGPGGGLRLEVSDSGPGLDGEALDRLLTDRPTRPGGGLGLRVVHDLAAQLGGRIEYHRSEGATVVAVTLPATRSTEAA